MGVVIRQGLKASLITYIGAFLGYLTWLRFFPLWLNPEEVGLIRALFDAVLLISPFLQGGVTSLVVKFSPYLATRIENERKFLGFALAVPFVLSIICAGIFLVFKEQVFDGYNEKSPLFAQYLWYVFPMAFFSVYIQLVESLIRIKLRIVVPRLVREILMRGLNLLVVALYFLQVLSLTQLVVGLIVINFIHVIILVFYYIRLRGVFVKPNLGIVKTRYFKPLLDYSAFMILGLGSGSLVGKIDSMMIAYFLGLTATGVYGIAFLIANFIDLPRRVFNSLITPLIATAYKAKNFGLLQTYYHRSSLNLSIISIFLFLGVWSNIGLVYSFIPDKEIYEAGKWVVFFIGLAKVFDMSMGINMELIHYTRYYRWNVYLSGVFAILAVITNLIFIPILGITGAALATVISTTLYNLIRFGVIYKKMGIIPFKFTNLWVALLGLLCFGLTQFIHISNVYIDFVVNGAVLTLLFLLPVWFFSLSPDFNSFVQNMAGRAGVNLKR